MCSIKNSLITFSICSSFLHAFFPSSLVRVLPLDSFFAGARTARMGRGGLSLVGTSVQLMGGKRRHVAMIDEAEASSHKQLKVQRWARRKYINERRISRSILLFAYTRVAAACVFFYAFVVVVFLIIAKSYMLLYFMELYLECILLTSLDLFFWEVEVRRIAHSRHKFSELSEPLSELLSSPRHRARERNEQQHINFFLCIHASLFMSSRFTLSLSRSTSSFWACIPFVPFWRISTPMHDADGGDVHNCM